jgi:hypothetical protein
MSTTHFAQEIAEVIPLEVIGHDYIESSRHDVSPWHWLCADSAVAHAQWWF